MYIRYLNSTYTSITYKLFSHLKSNSHKVTRRGKNIRGNNEKKNNKTYLAILCPKKLKQIWPKFSHGNTFIYLPVPHDTIQHQLNLINQ